MSAEVKAGLIYSESIGEMGMQDWDNIEPRGLQIGDVKIYIANQLKVETTPMLREDFRIKELKSGEPDKLKDKPNMIYYREKVNGAIYDNFAYAYINNVGRQIEGSIRADSESNLVECHYQHGDLWSLNLYVDDINGNWMMRTSEGIKPATLTNLQLALMGFPIVAQSDKTNFISLDIVDCNTFLSRN